MELTRENFEDFVGRLRHHNRGAGVNDHCTRDPLFVVQKRERIYGLDGQYVDEYEWRNTDDSEREADDRMIGRLEALDDGGRDTAPWGKVYYADRWEYVCAHFTREGADAFIARKRHDYRELRVYVDCQIYCWEYNAVIEGLLSGKIGFIE